MEVIDKRALPVFDRVTVWALLVVPCAWLPKVRLAGERLTTGPAPTPDIVTVC